MLLIGGTGIVGKAVIKEALKEDYNLCVIGLTKNFSISSKVRQIVVNRKDQQKFRELLEKESKDWDIIFDIAPFAKEDCEQVYNLFKNNTKHIFIMSTVLVYDRSKPSDKPIGSSHPLAKKGTLGGYVDHKLDVENFWKDKKDINWTILRPYHILSPEDSLLGCLPNHNRDPNLIENIKEEKELVLCEGGNIKFNYVNPTDIAKIVLKASGNPKTFHKAYNTVNPEITLAKDYFKLIARELGKKLKFKNKSIREVWEEDRGWQLTTLTHIYDVSDLKEDMGFIPNIPLDKTIREAIKNYKHIDLPISKIPVHQRMTLLPRPKPISWLF